MESILKDLRQGKMIILLDDAERENEGDLLVAAEKVTPGQITFMAKFGSGLICVPMTLSRAMELELPSMTAVNTSPLRCNFTVSVDAKKGVTTGISASDRHKTIKALVEKKTKPDDLHRPGHVFPLIARDGGVIERKGHTEGAVDLMKSAGLRPMAVICEIMGDDGKMLTGKKLKNFSARRKIPIIMIKDIINYRKTHPSLFAKSSSLRKTNMLVKEVTASIPTGYGNFKIAAYSSFSDNKEHIALIKGAPANNKAPLVRVHSECLTGDVFTSKRCDCNFQLHEGLKKIAREGEGILIYLRQEGRGIGLINKLKAYNLQDKGYDTVDANEKLGFKGDLRDYTIAAQILADLGISRIKLMTNNPEKISALEKAGIIVEERLPLEIVPRTQNDIKYLRAKKIKLGHLLSNV